jgi:hypothetical protein
MTQKELIYFSSVTIYIYTHISLFITQIMPYICTSQQKLHLWVHIWIHLEFDWKGGCGMGNGNSDTYLESVLESLCLYQNYIFTFLNREVLRQTLKLHSSVIFVFKRGIKQFAFVFKNQMVEMMNFLTFYFSLTKNSKMQFFFVSSSCGNGAEISEPGWVWVLGFYFLYIYTSEIGKGTRIVKSH